VDELGFVELEVWADFGFGFGIERFGS